MGTLGDRVKECREEFGWTQKELAAKVHMAQSSLAELEGGRSKESPKVVKLAIALKCSAYWLDSGKGPKKLGELEQAIIELSADNQKTIMQMIRVFGGHRERLA